MPENSQKQEDKKQTKGQKPTVGRIVHFLTEEGETLPAIITKVNDDDTVNLQAFTNNEHGNSVALLKTIVHGKKERQWSWPPRDGE